MGIKRILFQEGVCISGATYDVLIPLPANADECMRAIGINDFDDADDEWDADFNAIVDHLVGNIRYSISSVDPLTGQVEQLDDFTAERIQSFLASVDHLDLVINVAGTRTIRFTRGHEIFWLAGFARHDIESLPFALEPTQNARIGELF